MTVFLLIAIALISYFLGGLNGAIITSRLIYRDDIRAHGSGNPGLTNFYRTYGGRSIFLLLVIDVMKTAAPILASGWLLAQFAALDPAVNPVIIGRLWAGLFSMLGHAFPCLYGFRGGKCVLSGGTMVLFLGWQVALLALGIFVLIVLLTRYVSLGSISAGAMLPIACFISGFGHWAIFLAILGGGLLILRHLENIRRLIRGEERRLSFKRKKKEGEGP